MLRRLRAGRSYSSDVPHGRLELVDTTSDGMTHDYTVVVPATYDPSRRYPVRMFLHGGVEREDRTRGSQWSIEQLAGPDWIAVFPSGWREAMWWHATQAENLPAILRRLKRTYNVDEDRVYLLGMSDGGTGVYFFGMREASPWAVLLPFMGHPSVLANGRVGADGQLYVSNLANVPLFVVSGTRDPLYPAFQVQPFVDLFRQAGADVTFRIIESGHNFRWWPDEADSVGRYLSAHPRSPLPDRISWETERTDRYQRFRWLLVEQLGPAAGESALADWNTVTPPPPPPALGVGVEDDTGGVRLTRVDDGSVATTAGLAVRDVIVGVEGTPTPNTEALLGAVRHLDYGQRAIFDVRREGRGGVTPVAVRYPPAPEPEPPLLVFPHQRASGRVELERTGNEIAARTRGVRRFRLLLSPDRFDFRQPISVRANGRIVFAGVVAESVAVALRWFARDDDRAMLFAAEVEVQLPK